MCCIITKLDCFDFCPFCFAGGSLGGGGRVYPAVRRHGLHDCKSLGSLVKCSISRKVRKENY